ncbi:MAG: cofactor-independent phosphoglycerate mutase [Candidatus Omnitrophica bacterium]|nr:cofactor-independent phosphoglycerate mutase [Candidatus Omnitrophota bacterium]
MKYVLVIPDGMGDRPVKTLGGKTPLEAASTPNMDFFASHGRVGLSSNIPKGFIPGTDIGCMSVFGYDPEKYFTGRGPLEAAELGIKLRAGELAFRCNLVTVDGGLMKDFTADHISTLEAGALLRSLNERLAPSLRKKLKFYPGRGTGYRNLMTAHEADAALKSVSCTPPHDILGKKYADFLPKSDGSEFLIRLMRESLGLFKEHPVNQKRKAAGKLEASMIWLWGQGVPPHLPTLHERFGFKGAVITAVDLVKGIAIYAGMDVINVPGVTGFFDTNYAGKAEYAVRALDDHDLAVIHVESPDEAGHMGDARLKVKAIEDVDRQVLGTLRRGLEKFEDYKVMVLPDHFTCVETRTHSDEPVPFLIYSSRENKEGPEKFCEKTALKSGWTVSEGCTLMDLFVGRD